MRPSRIRPVVPLDQRQQDMAARGPSTALPDARHTARSAGGVTPSMPRVARASPEAVAASSHLSAACSRRPGLAWKTRWCGLAFSACRIRAIPSASAPVCPSIGPEVRSACALAVPVRRCGRRWFGFLRCRHLPVVRRIRLVDRPPDKQEFGSALKRQFALPVGQGVFAGAGAAALLLGAGAQLLFLAQPGRQPPQIVGGAAFRRGRQGAQRLAEIAQRRKAAPAAAESRPHRVECRHPAVGRPPRHRPHVGLQQVGVGQLQREAVGQLLQPDQHILDADRRGQRADGLFHPVGERTDLLRCQILRFEPQIRGVKPGQRGEAARLQGFRGCGRRHRTQGRHAGGCS